MPIARLSTAFSNLALPPAPRIVRDGLMAAWIFGDGPESFRDLSGNGYGLLEVGAPGFNGETTPGLLADDANYLQSNVRETDNLTWIVIARTEQGTANQNGGFALGTYDTRYSGSPDHINDRGAGVKLMESSGGNTSQALLAAHYRLIADSTAFRETPLPSNATPSYAARATWRWVSLTTENYTLRGYWPQLASPDRSLTPAAEYAFAGRRLTLDDDSPLLIRIGAVPDIEGQSNVGVEVAQVLIYDRALTAGELSAQYAYDQAYFLNRWGVTI